MKTYSEAVLKERDNKFSKVEVGDEIMVFDSVYVHQSQVAPVRRKIIEKSETSVRVEKYDGEDQVGNPMWVSSNHWERVIPFKKGNKVLLNDKFNKSLFSKGGEDQLFGIILEAARDHVIMNVYNAKGEDICLNTFIYIHYFLENRFTLGEWECGIEPAKKESSRKTANECKDSWAGLDLEVGQEIELGDKAKGWSSIDTKKFRYCKIVSIDGRVINVINELGNTDSFYKELSFKSQIFLISKPLPIDISRELPYIYKFTDIANRNSSISPSDPFFIKSFNKNNSYLTIELLSGKNTTYWICPDDINSFKDTYFERVHSIEKKVEKVVELEKFIKVLPIGTLVKRGPDWYYRNVDCIGEYQTQGVIVSSSEEHQLYRIEWENGERKSCYHKDGVKEIVPGIVQRYEDWLKEKEKISESTPAVKKTFGVFKT